MIGGDAVRLKQHDILVVFRHLDGTFDHVVKLDAPLLASGGTQPHHKGLPGLHPAQCLLLRQQAAVGEFPVIAGTELALLLFFPVCLTLLLTTEAGVGFALLHQSLDIGAVNLTPQALLIGTVAAPDFAWGHKALVNG